jgi:hypothetical protein
MNTFPALGRWQSTAQPGCKQTYIKLKPATRSKISDVEID